MGELIYDVMLEVPGIYRSQGVRIRLDHEVGPGEILDLNGQDGAKGAINTTDEYVRANPWRAVGISAGIGALIGFLIARR